MKHSMKDKQHPILRLRQRLLAKPELPASPVPAPQVPNPQETLARGLLAAAAALRVMKGGRP